MCARRCRCNMTGSNVSLAGMDENPTTLDFITVHDGFTMYDLFSYNQNNGCGLLNPVCCEAPLSVWCDTESGDSHNRSRDWCDGTDGYGALCEPFKRQLMRNMFTTMMISHGSPLILGGDEWMRTKYGNNNSYYIQADNEWNWFRWGEWRSETNLFRTRMHSRKRHHPIRKESCLPFPHKRLAVARPSTGKPVKQQYV